MVLDHVRHFPGKRIRQFNSLQQNLSKVMIWYQYLFLALAVVLYGLSQMHLFGKLKWQSSMNQFGWFGRNSWVRKYANGNHDKPRFFGSTTFLVMFTDFYHAAQAAQKVCFALGIFGITWNAGLFWIGWTILQWVCFKLFSK